MTLLREGILKIEFVALAVFGIVLIIRKTPPKKWFFKMAFCAYLFLVAAVCFFPIRIGAGAISVANNIIPFKSIVDSLSGHTMSGLKVVLGNFLMLTPLGVFFTFIVPKLKNRIFGVLLFSFSIEIVQFVIGLFIGYNYRSFDVDDIILNTVGGVISCLLCNCILKVYKKKKSTLN